MSGFRRRVGEIRPHADNPRKVGYRARRETFLDVDVACTRWLREKGLIAPVWNGLSAGEQAAVDRRRAEEAETQRGGAA